MQHHLAYRLVMTYIKPQVKGGIQTISRNLKKSGRVARNRSLIGQDGSSSTEENVAGNSTTSA